MHACEDMLNFFVEQCADTSASDASIRMAYNQSLTQTQSEFRACQPASLTAVVARWWQPDIRCVDTEATWIEAFRSRTGSSRGVWHATRRENLYDDEDTTAWPTPWEPSPCSDATMHDAGGRPGRYADPDNAYVVLFEVADDVVWMHKLFATTARLVAALLVHMTESRTQADVAHFKSRLVANTWRRSALHEDTAAYTCTNSVAIRRSRTHPRCLPVTLSDSSKHGLPPPWIRCIGVCGTFWSPCTRRLGVRSHEDLRGNINTG
jgi:hypothetical protein